MIVIGLTGSIGMGKSTTAEMFADLGIPVYDADAVVHKLYDQGGAAVVPVGAAFPGVVVDGRVDRDLLSAKVLGDKDALLRLESIVHPLVQEDRSQFMSRAKQDKADMVVLDIPLLFEKNLEATVDVIVVVSAPEEVQKQRVLERPGMTEEKLAAILAQQVPDADKRRLADFVIGTGQGLDVARAQVQDVVKILRTQKRDD